MLILTRMTRAEFPAFFELSAASYAEDSVAAGRWQSSEAFSLARAETNRLLPSGADSPDAFLRVIRREEDPSPVGYLWFATPLKDGRKVAFLYHLLIVPSFRRRGYGREALRAFEAEAATLGCDAVALNVFVPNEAARRLYESAGYDTTAVSMRKSLPDRQN